MQLRTGLPRSRASADRQYRMPLQQLPRGWRQTSGAAFGAGVMESNGGTRFVLYRKDRVRFAQGSELLREFRLTPGARTRRAVASCCNTPVFLEFQNGHWLSLYGCLWGNATPIPQLRTMTADLRDGAMLADDVPNAKRQSLSFCAKLIGAGIAMGFRSPKIPVYGELLA